MAAKNISYGDDARQNILRGVNKLADAVTLDRLEQMTLEEIQRILIPPYQAVPSVVL